MSQPPKRVRDSYMRPWVLFVIFGSTVLILVGASLLFSLVSQVDWHVCAALSLSLFLALVLLLVRAFGSFHLRLLSEKEK
jgi:hypothetical protein